MAWTTCSFQHGGNARNVNEGGFVGALRVDIRRGRCEDDIRMTFFELLAIFLEGARIACQIVGAVKLHWVNEDTHHHDICPRTRLIDQLHMAVMQIAHGWDQGDTFTFLTRATNMLAEQRQGFND